MCFSKDQEDKNEMRADRIPMPPIVSPNSMIQPNVWNYNPNYIPNTAVYANAEFKTHEQSFQIVRDNAGEKVRNSE